MSKQNPDSSELWRRQIAKIDRRLQRPNLAEDERQELWNHRAALFSGEGTADLDDCLRAIDRARRRRALAQR